MEIGELQPKMLRCFIGGSYLIWKYQRTQRIADAALEQIRFNLQTLDGFTETDILLTGGLNGTFCYVPFHLSSSMSSNIS
ncbi:hypothetical protein L1887_11929 [Cichorium endivia]|nr:hypothetical protein L1887_11929 [Cichorium endivia]